VKEGEVIVEESEVKNYNRDWTGNYIGKGEMVVVVSSTKELSQLMTYCNENLLAVTP
jgi:D-lactate dehydrogenase (cytochrome)